MLQRKYRTPESTWMGCSSEVGQMETTDWEALEGPQRVSLCWNEHGSWGGERKEGWREQGRGWLLKDQTGHSKEPGLYFESLGATTGF